MAVNIQSFYTALQGSTAAYDPKQGGINYELIHENRFIVRFDLLQISNLRNIAFYNGDNISIAARKIEVPNIGDNSKKTDEHENTFDGILALVDNNRKTAESNLFTISFLNMQYAPLERFFYQWYRETKSSVWAYDEYPFTKATVTVYSIPTSIAPNNITGNIDEIPLEYKFFDVFPTYIDTQDFEQRAEPVQNLDRKVTFTFNYMDINNNIELFKNENETDIRSSSIKYRS